MRTGKEWHHRVSALSARNGFGMLLRQVEDERRSLVIEKRGMPKAVLIGIRDYVSAGSPRAGSAEGDR